MLRDAVAELYAAFRCRALSSGGPAVCSPHCASADAVRRIAGATEPADVSFEDLREFHDAAKGEGAGWDMAFLLPRTLEFVARGRVPKTAGLFALFAHEFPPVWRALTDRERGAVRSYCRELVRWRLALATTVRCDYEPMDILAMAASGGFDVDPVLDALCDPPATDASDDVLVDLVLDHMTPRRKGRTFYATDERTAAHIDGRLRALVRSPATLARLERLALSDREALRAERASLAHLMLEHEMNAGDG